MPSDFKKTIVVAVSGGVDSVVLLDKLAKDNVSQLIVVAHVDHGIRDNSAEDAQFVAQLAKKYGAAFRSVRLELGKTASEDEARKARYKFLRELAKEYDAPVYTAHHGDDVVETIAINLCRGTGWRGVAVLGATDIVRPLTTLFKDEIIAYATQHNLTWHEDSTNTTDQYLRNRLRQKTRSLSKQTKCELLALWQRQREISEMIADECRTLATDKRYFYIMSDDATAEEVLRSYLANNNTYVTRPQLKRVLYGIKTAKAHSVLDIAGGKSLKIGEQNIFFRA